MTIRICIAVVNTKEYERIGDIGFSYIPSCFHSLNRNSIFNLFVFDNFPLKVDYIFLI
jgi:hypothetical protein